MPITDFLIQPITILTPGSTTNRYGDTVVDWDTATETAVKGWLDQSGASEVLGERDGQVIDAVLFLDASVAITATDRVVAEGTTYEVVGQPNAAQTPYGGTHHLEVNLLAVRG